MFIEQRIYTLKPGCLTRFWDLQSERGFDVVKPIMDRLVGYFGRVGRDCDEVIHLWRFDSHADWVDRLHGLYGRPELAPYFREVRALMLRQENMILAPAPLTALTPNIGNGNDWLPKDGPRMRISRQGPVAIDIETLNFHPGALPSFWDALSKNEHALPGGIVGGFVSVIGTLHRVVIYRLSDAGVAGERWNDFLDRCSPSIASRATTTFQSAPVKRLVPIIEGSVSES